MLLEPWPDRVPWRHNDSEFYGYVRVHGRGRGFVVNGGQLRVGLGVGCCDWADQC